MSEPETRPAPSPSRLRHYCGPACITGRNADRRAGVIYPLNHNAVADKYNACRYCGAQLHQHYMNLNRCLSETSTGREVCCYDR